MTSVLIIKKNIQGVALSAMPIYFIKEFMGA